MEFFKTTTTFAAAACLTLGTLAGCETAKEHPRTTGAAAGAGAGALAGSAIAGKGQKTEGALIGGAVGAAGGWLAGDQYDKHQNDNDKDREEARERYRDRYEAEPASSRHRVYDRDYDPYDRF